MITEAILNCFMILPKLFIGLLPSLEFSLPNGVADVVSQLLYCIGYVVPVMALMPILQISFAVMGVKIIWALTIRTKSFIPTMGS